MERCYEPTLPGTILVKVHYLYGFFIIGGFTTFIDICLLYIMTDWFGIWFMYSAFISYSIGAIISYLLNKFLNFKNTHSDMITQGCVFYGIACMSMALNLSVLYTCVEGYGLTYLYAKLVATGAGFLVNYMGQSLITFKRWR